MSETQGVMNRVRAAFTELNASLSEAGKKGVNIRVEIDLGKDKKYNFYSYNLEKGGVKMVSAEQRRQLL